MKDFDYCPPDVPLRILHQDALIMVVDKPSGLLSVPGMAEVHRGGILRGVYHLGG